MMKRRALMGGALSLPLLGQRAVAQGTPRVMRFAPASDLSSLDPIWTSSYPMRNHGYMVFDTLYGTNTKFQVSPQMAEGHTVSADGLVWDIRLRDGLRFHDGTPVLARDCVQSIRRWAARDGYGQTLMGRTDELAVTDDRTVRFRLKAPFPLLPAALGKLSSPVPFMMPERLALTDPNQQIREAVGSGPFRFLPGEWVQGSHVAYARFDGYVPRNEAPDASAGGKRVNLDRVEWRIMPDAASAAEALQTNEIDWLQTPSYDLLSVLRGRPGIKVSLLDDIGTYIFLRFNTLFPPFDDVRARRAVLHAVNQEDYLQALVGDSVPSRRCAAMFPCGTPYGTEAGSKLMDTRLDEARAMLKTSNYDGRKVVILNPGDLPSVGPMGDVTADLLQKLGMQVDLQVMDWGSLLARRALRKPPSEGGWNIFHTGAPAPEYADPASNYLLRGNGDRGWPGWFADAALEALRERWLAAPDPAAQAQAALAMQDRAFDTVPYVPLGQYLQATAFRDTVTGVLPGSIPAFWNVRKS